MNEDILLILSVTSQPRYINILNHYLSQGHNVTVASFEREYLDKNKLPEKIVEENRLSADLYVDLVIQFI